MYTHQGAHLVLDKGRPATLFEGQIVQGRSSFQRSGSVEFSLLPSLALSSLSLLPRDRACLLDRDHRVERGRNETITPFTIRVCLLPAAYMTSDVKRTDERGRDAFVCKQRKEQMDKGPKRNEEGNGNEILTLCGHTETEIWVPCWLDLIFNGRISVSRFEASEKIRKISEI